MSGSGRLASWEEAVVWLRNQPQHRQLVHDAFYDDPLMEAAKRYRQTGEWRSISDLLKGRSGSALDVGAGRGIASYALACEKFSVTALEPDPSPVVGAAAIRALARDTGLPIEIVEDHSEHLPFSDISFDVVFVRAALHHTSNLEQACREFYRVLKPGGVLIAAREHVITKDADLDSFLQQHPLHHLYGGEQAFRLDRYVSALKTAGFEPLEVLPPLTSPINLYPHTFDSLRLRLVARMSSVMPAAMANALAPSQGLFRWALAVAGLFDNRPGRLYSFVAHKASR